MPVINVNDIGAINEQKQIMVVNNNSNQNILLIGSCRMTPFLNYLIHHDLFGVNYNYLCILVHIPQMKQLSEEIIHNEHIKSQLFKSTILIAEYMRNYNYFNTQRDSEKCIFRVYDSFSREIILPNWPDTCLYVKDIVHYKNLQNEFKQFLNKEINIEQFGYILQTHRQKELQRHFSVLNKSKAPWHHLINYTLSNLNDHRLGYTLNHPTNLYFIEMYRLLIEHFFAQSPYFLPQSVIELNRQHDFLRSDSTDTKLTYYDRLCFGCTINEHYLDENESNHYILNG